MGQKVASLEIELSMLTAQAMRDVGDFGYVQYHGATVPVIVADTGPFAKLGEGSIALHRALGRELCSERDTRNTCTRVGDDIESIDSDVVTVLFPGSVRHDPTPREPGDEDQARGEATA